MIEAVLTVKSEQGLHARPADLFVRAANRFQSNIQVRNLTSESGYVNAKSILKILALGVYSGYKIQIAVEGPDEAAAVEEITALIKGNFKE
ncbi:MAG: HPr family phosphocarrier protein [Pelolinea sp.]|nr:HPr family phosphocarrier protein [Pelolinea sp.]